MNENLLNAIVANADLYCRENLNEDPHRLESDWWLAFNFFIGHACFQGRRDTVSSRVYENARQILAPLFSGEQKDNNYQSQKQEQWNDLKVQLRGKIGKGKIGKARDVDMIISALRFLDRLPNKNIVAYSVSKIRAGQLQQHYTELQASTNPDGIIQVGPKIAAFYLRDLVSLFSLDRSVDDSAAFCLQAVDTWVKKLSEKLGIVGHDADAAIIQRAIVKMCREHNISPLRFNQGAWYTAYHSFDLLLEQISTPGQRQPLQVKASSLVGA